MQLPPARRKLGASAQGHRADDTVVPGDVVVTEQNAKHLSQPRIGADGKPIRPDPRAPATAAAPAPPAPTAETPVQTDPTKRTVRTVGQR